LSYLTPEYLKRVPACPTGHAYEAMANCPGYWGAPMNCTMALCLSGDPNAYHPGVGSWGPQYVIGKGLRNY